MQLLAGMLLGLALASLFSELMTERAVFWKLRRDERKKRSQTPPISVLKPLKGLEPGLYENLASLASQDYEHFELVIGAEDPDDPALAIARQLRREFPHVAIKIVEGANKIGLNPKVNNVSRLSQAASHDVVLISDSNVRADRDYLTSLVACLDPDVGLVSSLLVGVGERSLGALLDNLHLNTFMARAVCGAEFFIAQQVIIGKSMLFRRSHLAQIGGFEAVKDVLAEDHVLGQKFQELGLRLVISPHRLQARSVDCSVASFVKRHLRWNQMRWRLAPGYYLAEPLGAGSVWWLALLLASFMGAGMGPISSAALSAVAVFGLTIKLFADAWLVRTLRGIPLGLSGTFGVVLKDVLVLFVWVGGAFKRSVTWRGHHLVIGRGSALRPAAARAISPVIELS